MEIYVRQIANEWVVKCADGRGNKKGRWEGREEVKKKQLPASFKNRSSLPMIGKPNTLPISCQATKTVFTRSG